MILPLLYSPGETATPSNTLRPVGEASESVFVVSPRGVISLDTNIDSTDIPKAEVTDNASIKSINEVPEKWTDQDAARFEELVRQKASARGSLSTAFITEFEALQQKRRRETAPISGEQIIFNRREREARRKLRALIEEYIELF